MSTGTGVHPKGPYAVTCTLLALQNSNRPFCGKYGFSSTWLTTGCILAVDKRRLSLGLEKFETPRTLEWMSLEGKEFLLTDQLSFTLVDKPLHRLPCNIVCFGHGNVYDGLRDSAQ